jgi:menaquinone-dependent protoporphyrinogen oxidase
MRKEDKPMETKDSKQWRINRRDFLVLTGGIISAMSLGSISPAGFCHAAVIKFTESKCEGKSMMGKKILVAYASKYGSTGGVADAIGKELCSKGATVDVLLTKNAINLSSYQGLVLGSAIYKGKWLPDAVDFVKTNCEIFRQVPVAYFLVCITMYKPTEENRRKVLAYLDPVLQAVPQVKPVVIGTFAGALDYSNLSWPNKKIMEFKGAPEGDFRDWDAIRSWAGQPAFMKFMGM